MKSADARRTNSIIPSNGGKANSLSRIYHNWQLYVLLALPVIYILVFYYYPMLGAQIAFRDYTPRGGIWGSHWVGLKYFKQFYESIEFWKSLKNTFLLSFYFLIAGFPFPIMLAISLNCVAGKAFKKAVQMVSYIPYFISTVVMCGMIRQVFNPRTGIVNNFIQILGGQSVDFMASDGAFPSIYVWTGIWQYIGFSAIIYIAALSSISIELHEAAIIDGASIFKRAWYIDIPGIMPTAIILLILNTGQMLNVGFEKVLLLQTPLNLNTSEIISTYVYKVGLMAQLPRYSYSTAIGLFQSVINCLLLLCVNKLAGKVSETSLW